MVGDPVTEPTDNLSLSELADQLESSETAEELEIDGEEVEGEEGEEAAPDSEDEPDEGESDDEDEQEEEATVTIKVNGKDVTLKQSEVVEMAQKGADYTQKTMALAEERKAVDAEREQAKTYREQKQHALNETVNQLQAFAGFMEAQLGEPPSIDLLHTHGSDVYLAQKEQYEHRRAKLGQAYQAIQQVQQEAQRERQAWIAERAEATEKALRDTLPGWNDETLNQLAEYAGKHGITPQAAGEVFVEKGLWELLHKAKAYDALQEQRAKLKPKSELPKVQKPSASNQPNRAALKQAEALKRYNANPGSIDALANLIG